MSNYNLFSKKKLRQPYAFLPAMIGCLFMLWWSGSVMSETLESKNPETWRVYFSIIGFSIFLTMNLSMLFVIIKLLWFSKKKSA